MVALLLCVLEIRQQVGLCCFCSQTSRDQMLNEVRTLCELPELEGLVNFHGAFYTPEDGRISIALEYMNGTPTRTETPAPPD
jgi:hypothetical protein